MLDWTLLSKYNNEASKAGKHGYKAEFALLPTVDHVDSSSSDVRFCVCAWRTNDAKHDLTHQAFIDLCENVLIKAGYLVDKRGVSRAER